MKNLYLFTFMLFVLISCKTEYKKNENYFDLSKDTVFFMNNLPDDAQEIVFSQHSSFWNIMLSNIYISVYDNRNKYHFIIKEFGKDSIKRFYYFQDKMTGVGIKYDSAFYDSEIFAKMIIENDFSYSDSLSPSFFNIHKLRKKDSTYQSQFIKYNDKLSEVEEIVNNMEVFNNFSIKNHYQTDLLKRLLFHLRMSTLSYNDYNN